MDNVNPETEKLNLKKEIIQAFLQQKEEELQAMTNLQAEELEEARISKSEPHDMSEEGKASEVLQRIALRKNAANSLKNDVDLLQSINVEVPFETVGIGAIIITDLGGFLYGIASTHVDVAGQSFNGIAPDSPVGLEMHGKQLGDIVHFGQLSYTILEIY